MYVNIDVSHERVTCLNGDIRHPLLVRFSTVHVNLREMGAVIGRHQHLGSCFNERQCTSCFSCVTGFGSIAQPSHISTSGFWCLFVISWFSSLNVHKWACLQNWQAKRSCCVHPGRVQAFKNATECRLNVGYSKQKRKNAWTTTNFANLFFKLAELCQCFGHTNNTNRNICWHFWSSRIQGHSRVTFPCSTSKQ